MSRILLVDDHSACRERLAELLRTLGHCVDCACSAAGAIDHLRRFGSDLIILDVLMPQMQGWQVLQWSGSHRRSARTPVIVHSALTELQWQLALPLGASELWERGAISFGRICDSIETHLGQPIAIAA